MAPIEAMPAAMLGVIAAAAAFIDPAAAAPAMKAELGWPKKLPGFRPAEAAAVDPARKLLVYGLYFEAMSLA